MLLVPANKETFHLTMAMDELAIIHQSLNEVCHGFRLDNFEEVVGNTKKFAKEEMDKLRQLYVKDSRDDVSLEVSKDELNVMRNAVRETCKEIDEWEYSIRIGGLPKSMGLAVLSSLDSVEYRQTDRETRDVSLR